MHAVRKEESTTTKLHNHQTSSPIIDVLLRFRTHRIAVELITADRDFHCFVWRNNPKDPLLDYRMTRITFGVSICFLICCQYGKCC